MRKRNKMERKHGLILKVLIISLMIVGLGLIGNYIGFSVLELNESIEGNISLGENITEIETVNESNFTKIEVVNETEIVENVTEEVIESVESVSEEIDEEIIPEYKNFDLYQEESFVPIGLQKWQNIDNKDEFKQVIGGVVANYQKEDNSWALIENEWMDDGDFIVNNKDVLKTKVSKNGELIVDLEWEGEMYTVKQKLIDLVFIDKKTGDSFKLGGIGEISFGTPVVKGNIIKWKNVVDGVDIEIIKQNGQISHKLIYNPSFLTKAIDEYELSSEPENIVLGNEMEIELVNVDDVNFEGDVYERILKEFPAKSGRGDYEFKIDRQQLQYDGVEDEPMFLVLQNWKKKNGKMYLTEYVDMEGVKKIYEKNPSKAIFHYDSVVIGTADIEDAMIRGGVNVDKNYGGSTAFGAYPAVIASLVRVRNVATNLGAGAAITNVNFSAYCYDNQAGSGTTISAFRVFKPWVEGDESGVDNDDGDVTWNDWASDAKEWTVAGVGGADDGGSDNSEDGSGADRKATPESYENIDAATAWFNWTISNSLGQGWYDGSINEEGIFLDATAGQSRVMSFYSVEAADPSLRPYFTFYYTSNTAPTDPSILINSTTGGDTNYTNETLMCTFDCIDADVEANMYYNITWLKNNVTELEYLGAAETCVDDARFDFNLSYENTSKNELWNCQVQICDDEDSCSNWVNSSQYGIGNYPPPAPPDLHLPVNNSVYADEFNIALNWSNMSEADIDGDEYMYYLEIWDESTATNLRYANISVNETSNVTTSDEFTFPSASDDYFWRVLAYDGEDNSSWSEMRNITFVLTVLDPCTPPISGDWKINTTCDISDITYDIATDGSILIQDAGTLNLDNVVFNMTLTGDGTSNITVFSYGQINISGGSNITSSNSANEFKFIVEENANFSMTDSFLSEAGYNDDVNERGLEINGTIIDFDNNELHYNYYGLVLYSDGNNITNSDIYTNVYGGIRIGLNASESDGADNNLIKDCAINGVSATPEYGIHLVSGSYNIINLNDIRNSFFGYYVNGTENNITDNRCAGASPGITGDCISISGVGNYINGTGCAGAMTYPYACIHLIDAQNTTSENNVDLVNDIVAYNISADSSFNLIDENGLEIMNTYLGIFLEGDNNTIKNVELTVSSFGWAYGILLDGSSNTIINVQCSIPSGGYSSCININGGADNKIIDSTLICNSGECGGNNEVCDQQGDGYSYAISGDYNMDFATAGTYRNTLLNTTYTEWCASNDAPTKDIYELEVQWYLDVAVNYTNDTIAYKANVSAWNVSDTFAFSELTGGDGKVLGQNLTEYVQNHSTETWWYTNYSINTTQPGYDVNFQSLNLTTNTVLNVTLERIAPIVMINSTDGTNRTLQNLTCSFTPSSYYDESLEYNVTWLKDNVTQADLVYDSIGATNNTLTVTKLIEANTTRGDLWSCQIQFCETVIGCSRWANSTQIEILNTPPNQVVLSEPPDNNWTTNRSITFEWTASSDDDGDTLFYDLFVEGMIISSDEPTAIDVFTVFNITGIDYNTINYLTLLEDNDYRYNWTVRAFDNFTNSTVDAYGINSTTFNLTIAAEVNINLTKDNVTFVDLTSGQSASSYDLAEVEDQALNVSNIGNCMVNISITEDSDYPLWTGLTKRADFFAMNISHEYDNYVNEGSCSVGYVNYGNGISEWLNIPSSSSDGHVCELNQTVGKSSALVYVNVTVPSDESAGNKGTILTFTGSLAE